MVGLAFVGRNDAGTWGGFGQPDDGASLDGLILLEKPDDVLMLSRFVDNGKITEPCPVAAEGVRRNLRRRGLHPKRGRI